MNTSLTVFGLVFLVLGGLLYVLPMQAFTAQTTTVGGATSDTRTSSTWVNIPVQWAYAVAIFGLLFFLLGLAIPSQETIEKEAHVVTTKNVETGRGKDHKVVREHTEKHVGKIH
jgi:hypothetical protein